MGRTKGCRICHSRVAQLMEDGRCRSCYTAAEATRRGMHYGDYVAMRDFGGKFPEPLPPKELSRTGDSPVIIIKPKKRFENCLVCGGIIPSNSPRRKYCSEQCYEIAAKAMRRENSRMARARKKSM